MPVPRRRVIALVVLGIAASAIGAALVVRRVRGPTVAVVEAARRELAQRVVATGRVLPPARAQLGVQIAGVALAVRIDRGERAEAGQVLVELDDADARAQVASARAQVASAQARLEQLRRVSTSVAQQALEQASANFRAADQRRARVLDLERTGAATAQDRDEAERGLSVARAQMDSAAAQLRATGTSDERLAVAQLEAAQAQVAAAEARKAQTRVVAPFAGIVLARSVEPGDVITPGKVLIVLARDGKTELVASPDEKTLALVGVGPPARAAADAFPDRPFAAVVSEIAPSVDPLRGTVELRLAVAEPPAFLRADMTVSVDIEVARHAGALVLPIEAVRDAAGAAPWVLVLEAGSAARRPVTIGLRGEGSVEITSGLRDGELAVLPTGAGARLAPGDRASRASDEKR